ncbi:hypothetical protein KJ652_06445 [Patescibacteria group bacterium]|nr:hypothetical protein [Patescibacteria group bacterium]MBU1124190.1 hypothetical protein [Patescibacteria group bacterium]MBU1911654.1 hypothetical protein [Patescibacteria group bacterium]
MPNLSPERAISILKDVLPETMERAGKRGLEIQRQPEIVQKSKTETGNERFDLVTEADLALQEIVLKELIKTELRRCIIKPEEETPTTKKFTGEVPISITIDPVNGTQRFINRSKAWEIMVGAQTPDQILYTCSRSPGFDYTLEIDEEHGIKHFGRLPDIPKDVIGDNAIFVKNRERFLEQFPEMAEHLSLDEYQFQDSDPHFDAINGRLGRNMTFVAGLVKGILKYRANVYDGLLPAHYAKHSGGKVVTFGCNGDFAGKIDLTNTIDCKGMEVFKGGYLALNKAKDPQESL